jgi:uncharacterized membrane protein YeaQ/YmgE (transglycosylase-associated protein family)
MSVLAWLVLGLVSGFIGSKIVKPGGGTVMSIVIEVMGAFAGGLLFMAFGSADLSGLNPYSSLVAAAGSIVCLVIYNGVFRSA